MNDEKNLNITVNPTANTAITTLIMLANAHYEKALAILEKMGVENPTLSTFQEFTVGTNNIHNCIFSFK